MRIKQLDISYLENPQNKRKVTESQALKRMAAHCSRTECCIYDIRRKLSKMGMNEEETERILAYLTKERFIDEERFCRSFINDKLRFNKWGEVKIRYELRKREIPEKLYNPILQSLDAEIFEPKLMHILSVKEKSVKAKDIYDKRNKLIRFALGRGYNMDMIIKCINKLLGNVEDDI